MPTVKDQDSKPIKEGDTVWTKIRGGKREGEVERVVTSEEEAKSEGVKNPPKVGICGSSSPADAVLTYARPAGVVH